MRPLPSEPTPLRAPTQRRKFRPGGNLRISEIWDSREQLEAFGKHLTPVLADIGIELGEPELLEIHNIIKP